MAEQRLAKKCSDVPDLLRGFTKPGSILGEAAGTIARRFAVPQRVRFCFDRATLDSTPTWA